MMAFLQLMRLPTLFTALADIFAGYVLAHRGLETVVSFSWLLAASGGLYLSGMVWNDVFDVAQDHRERPTRPIPSGRVSRGLAILLAVALMTFGLTAAWQAGHSSFLVAIAIAGMVLLYDAIAKKSLLGPLAMGGCRFLNIMLGASTVGWQELQEPRLMLMASAIGLYIAGVTWFARNEASTSQRWQLIGALVVVNLGIALEALMMFFTKSPSDDRRLAVSLMILVMIAASVNRVVWGAIRSGESRAIQRSIGHLLLSLIMLDAAAVYWQMGPSPLPFAVALLVTPAILLKRWVPMT